MLVLSRTLNQKILIGEDIEIAVVAVEGKKVRLGITAPRTLPINREEVAKLCRKTPIPTPEPAYP